MSTQRSPLPPVPTATTIDGVVEAIGSIIDWSIATSSRLGYFAALYKRITIAVGVAIDEDKFEDGPRMERFDVAFANHYFAALNGHFHPDSFGKPPRAWRVSFDAEGSAAPIILQHMLAGINAHIDLDLGIAAQEVSPRWKLPALHDDFNRVNAVLAGQVNDVLDRIHELSPALADLYAVLRDHQVFVINEAVRSFRDSAWRFATILALEPAFVRPVTISLRDRKVSRQAGLIYDPPGLIGLIDQVVRDIAARESDDIVRNIQVLDRIASTPAPIRTAL
jgi:Family of unknown function (DUF5995)